jgi:Ser/Thr protein kinase RdoA (MazF antagonist)
MMRLKNLFDNRNLAMMLLSNWDYDANRLDALNKFRISANAIYPFFQQDRLCFLRFAPLDEKSSESVQAELDFLQYLRDNDYPAPETIPSLNDEELVVRNTPWGKYLAVVFATVPGKRFDYLEYSEELYNSFGAALGWLHAMSTEFKPGKNRRSDWKAQLDQAEKILTECNGLPSALEEVRILRTFLSALPKKGYGLVHYDFQLDNVFYDAATKTVTPIDFDDAIEHWYIMDIAQVFESIAEEQPESVYEEARESFLNGYRTEMELDETMLGHLPMFLRYAALIRYSRCLYSTHEKYEHEPKWMVDLREHLAGLMEETAENFGKPVE